MASNVVNGTVVLPKGTTNHGNVHILCFPTKWTDLVVFFLGNYVAHAATIVLSPGSSALGALNAGIFALLYPVTGVNRGFRAIFSLAKFASTDLEVAARAGALCRVVREGEYAQTSAEVSITKEPSRVHGRVRLPPGYCFAIVPRNARFVDNEKGALPATLASDYSVVKVLAALAQLGFAISTLYRSRGDQVERYGYAAFGLTVTQYALMSFINLLGNLICPQYPAVYLVESEIMTEAQRNPDAVFLGVVGKLLEDIQDRERDRRAPINFSSWRAWRRRLCWAPVAWTPTALTVVIIWALSRFRSGSSTTSQRWLTMSWLAVGSWVGAVGLDFPMSTTNAARTRLWRYRYLNRAVLMLPAAVAISGFYTVGKMIDDYGVCTLVS